MSFGGLAGHLAIAISTPASSKWPHHHCWFRWVQSFHQVTAWLKACSSQREPDKRQSTRELRWDRDKEPEVSSSARNQGESTANTSHPSSLLPHLCQTSP